jgi:hypothetical protein
MGILRREFPATPNVPWFQAIATFHSYCVAGDPRTASNVLLVGSIGTIQRASNGFIQPPIAFTPEVLANMATTNQIVAIVTAPSRPGMAYGLASNGKIWRKADIASTTLDDGAHWRTFDQGPTPRSWSANGAAPPSTP